MIEDFYPTPTPLIQRMLEGIDLENVEHILEPSAGKGDICDYIQEAGYRHRRNKTIDVIEINPDLQHILRGKEYRLIQDDFLTFDTNKVYDLIVANFPFSTGDQHLQKAISLLEKNGGRLVCLVNAETIRNPYTRLREMVALKLQKHGAEIEYLAGEFEQAERPTSVEVALVKLSVERPDTPSVILDSLKRAEEAQVEEDGAQPLVEHDFMASLVARFNVECRCGIRLIEEYFSLKPYVSDRFVRESEKNEKFDYTKQLIELKVEGAWESKASYINSYLSGVRHKYWELLIHDPRFNSFYTSNILSELNSKLTELRDYDFTLFNIQELTKEMNSKIIVGIEQSILNLFEKFSRKYAWDESLHEGNVHYYNGWKTNKAHKINKKIIVPINGISAYSKQLEYRIHEELSDMVKVFNYLSEDRADVGYVVGSACRRANNLQKFSSMDLGYFETTFYKKGTCHIKFTDQKLLDKFNIFGSQRKGWLPPAYGKKPYEEMDSEEREVIDDFQSKEAYAEVVRHSDYYLVESTALLQLGS
jgi:phospholipid N-methyltransferase